MNRLRGKQRVSLTLVVPAIVAALGLATVVFLVWRALFLLPSGPSGLIDLDYYRTALVTVVAENPLYADLPYPPVAVLVIAWLAGLPPALGDQVWTAMSIVMALALGMLVAKRATEARGGSGIGSWDLMMRGSVAAMVLLVSMPMGSQLDCGQVTLIIITLAFLDVAQVTPKRLQGVLVGIAAAIKLTPLIFIPYFLVTGQRRQAAVATGSFGLATAVGFLLFPGDSLVFWANLGKHDQFGDPGRLDNLSISAALVRWLPEAWAQSRLWIVLGLIVAGMALWRARNHYRRGETMEAALTVGACSVVLAPIGWPHYHVWVVLVALWLILSANLKQVVLGIAVFLVYSLPYRVQVVGEAQAGNLLGVAGIDLRVLIPVLIGIFGLPHRAAPTLGSGSELATEPKVAKSAGWQVRSSSTPVSVP